jgi:hypothetical protein
MLLFDLVLVTHHGVELEGRMGWEIVGFFRLREGLFEVGEGAGGKCRI